jgi:hypothetical protein
MRPTLLVHISAAQPRKAEAGNRACRMNIWPIDHRAGLRPSQPLWCQDDEVEDDDLDDDDEDDFDEDDEEEDEEDDEEPETWQV